MLPRIDVIIDENETHVLVTRTISEEEALRNLGFKTAEEAHEHFLEFEEMLEKH